MAFIEYPPLGNLRDGPFVRGRRYRVLHEAPSYSGDLAIGEILTYFGPYIGIYDGVYVYAFTNEKGQERTWLRRFKEPEECWSRIFSALPDAGGVPDFPGGGKIIYYFGLPGWMSGFFRRRPWIGY